MPPANGEVRSKVKTLPLGDTLGYLNSELVEDYHAADRTELPLLRRLAVAADLLAGTLQFALISTLLMLKALLRLLLPLPQSYKSIRGQLALVTGGGNGLGRELSLELARCGARVAVVDIDSRAAEETARELCQLTGHADTARAYTVDVSSPESIRKLHIQISADWSSPVDILVNNAGLMSPVSLFNGVDADIDRIVDVNLKSHFWMLRAFLPSMVSANRGHVVSICSMAGVTALSGACAYTATKFGVRGLALAVQAELLDAGADNVRVTTAYPYFLTTRKEVIDNVELRIPPIDPEAAARQIVAGVRRNALHVSVPSSMLSLTTFVSTLPDEVVELFRKTYRVEIKESDQITQKINL